MFRRLVLESLRSRLWQAVGAAASTALASATLLSCVGIHQGIGRNPSLQRLMVGLWTSGLLLFVAAIAFVVAALAQYVEVRQRTQEYGVLTVLGASRAYLVALLLQEGVLIAFLGSAIGIALAFLAKAIVVAAFSQYLTLTTVYLCWPVAWLCSLIALMAGGLAGIRRAVAEGIEEALSYHKQ